MNISEIKNKAAEQFKELGFSPPPKKWSTQNRRIWICEMWENEKRELKQDE